MADHDISKVEELLYTMKVEDVMAGDTIVVDPELSMAEVKHLMDTKQITGVPVVQGDRMVGIVSISDVIDALEKGLLLRPVKELMTTDVKSVTRDTSVIELVKNLGRRGFGRLPVLNGEGKVVGIVTTGTLLRSLLTQMEMSYQKKEQEKLQRYRASHIFEDISSDDTSIVLRYIVDDKDFTNAGKASTMIKKSLQRLGAQPPLVRRVAVAVYEAEMNLVIHTDVGGEILVTIRSDRLQIATVDHGPGIENLDQVLQPGYSTAPEWIRQMGFGAGMGLANIKRCSDVMRLMSEPGAGTRLDILFLFGAGGLSGAGGVRKKS
jgi:CBS domain-containing protein/anti-sigma regulatory factor (Ser/Thr protein kinase)